MSSSILDTGGRSRVSVGAAAIAEPCVLPLNDFQRLMLGWIEYQPFHVNDVVEVAGSVDAARLQTAAEAELTAAGVAWPIPNRRDGTVTYDNRPITIPVQIVETAGRSPREALADKCSAELNEPFVPGLDPFLRLWVLRPSPLPLSPGGRGDRGEGPHQHIGMTWQHWPCDGYAAADLLRRILARYFSLPAPRHTVIDSRKPADLATAYAPWRTLSQRLFQLRKSVHEVFKLSRAYAAPRPSDPKTPLQTHFLDLPDDLLARIQQAAARNQATVNDVVAAALLRTLAGTIPASNIWQRRTSVSNIVDLRQLCPELLGDKWGMFLGFCIFNCVNPIPANQDELIRHVRWQSRRTKASKSYFASLNAMRMSRRLWPWLYKPWRWTLSRRLGNFSAACSNLRLPPAWFPPPWSERLKAWWRTLPIGVTVPLSVGVTTFDTRLTITLTTEHAGPLFEQVDSLKRELAATLELG